jgi:hypothetical protein
MEKKRGYVIKKMVFPCNFGKDWRKIPMILTPLKLVNMQSGDFDAYLMVNFDTIRISFSSEDDNKVNAGCCNGF